MLIKLQLLHVTNMAIIKILYILYYNYNVAIELYFFKRCNSSSGSYSFVSRVRLYQLIPMTYSMTSAKVFENISKYVFLILLF